jgi:hypothetical protein
VICDFDFAPGLASPALFSNRYRLRFNLAALASRRRLVVDSGDSALSDRHPGGKIGSHYSLCAGLHNARRSFSDGAIHDRPGLLHKLRRFTGTWEGSTQSGAPLN